MIGECREPAIERLNRRAIERNTPLNVLFELTHRCNLRCRHCYMVPETAKEFSLDEIKATLDQLAKAGTLFLTLSGGEILLRNDFLEIAQYARSRDFALRLFTNGTLVTEAMADNIAALMPLDVGISIYGPDAESHEFMTCVPDSFSASVNALKLLGERGVTTRLKCLLMNHNVKDIERIAALADELKATVLFDPLVTPRINGDPQPLVYKISDEDMAAFVYRDTPQGDIVLEDTIPCSAGRTMMSISPGGRIYPCVQFPASLGNLREQSFESIWFGSNEAHTLRSIRVSDLTSCASCTNLKYCQLCLGLNTIETGDLHVPSRLSCWLAQVKKESIEKRKERGFHEAVNV